MNLTKHDRYVQILSARLVTYECPCTALKEGFESVVSDIPPCSSWDPLCLWPLYASDPLHAAMPYMTKLTLKVLTKVIHRH